MKVASGYGVEIRKQNICFRKTMYICRRAVMYLTEALGACEGLGTDTGAET